MNTKFLSVMAGVMLLLAGCGKTGSIDSGKVTSQTEGNSGKLNPGSDAAWNQKVQAYIVIITPANKSINS
jgi:hypothetical protein